MTPDYKIRAACPADMPYLIGLCGDHASYEGATFQLNDQITGLSEAIFSPQPRIWCKVAEEKSGRLVGYCTYMLEYATWRAGNYIHMDCLYLQPEARQQGIGKGLMNEMIGHAHRLGITEIQWQTPEDNADAIGFYQRMGAAGKKKMRFFLNVPK